ncbi:MAG TPA: BrnT family toxin [Terriglobia bacterium]|nr:BrnT family toxin [Terriglobia bacterium]
MSLELASTVFADPRLLTVADLEHNEVEERWFTIGWVVVQFAVAKMYHYHLLGEQRRHAFRRLPLVGV